MDDKSQSRLAVLIDADNAQSSIIAGLLDEIAQYGVASVKRIYGDWTDTRLKGWKTTLLEHGINPVQQFAYTTGKNATDSALIIDAMDLLYSEKLDGYCIVSSDSDFTRLASRIREAGLKVYGFGEKKTPKAFVSACDKFIYTEILRETDEASETREKKTPSKSQKIDLKVLNMLRHAVEDTTDEAGWSHLGSVGQNILNKSPDFDPRNYGFKKLRDLIENTKLFEFKEVDPLSRTQTVRVRLKRKRSYE
ncbi:NYN domain-containing protein [Sulfurimonas sp. HSL3-7]|uniref:NYN domain-containing protein n=1 Tax=Sulfonitrofixus jiaomeiensis TaxID=3131938 RepID=UPI0031F7B28B